MRHRIIGELCLRVGRAVHPDWAQVLSWGGRDGLTCVDLHPSGPSEASPRTAEVVVGLAGDLGAGWGQAGGLS